MGSFFLSHVMWKKWENFCSVLEVVRDRRGRVGDRLSASQSEKDEWIHMGKGITLLPKLVPHDSASICTLCYYFLLSFNSFCPFLQGLWNRRIYIYISSVTSWKTNSGQKNMIIMSRVGHQILSNDLNSENACCPENKSHQV